MKRSFCTCFDHNYMVYGLTMFRSLAESGIEFELYVLCLSDKAFEMLESLQDSRLIPLDLKELEAFDPVLKGCEKTRSKAEYIFTISPCLPLWLFHKFPQLELLTYLDADLHFTSTPEPLFQELGEKSLYVTEHRFAPGFENDILNGRFNVAFQIYRNNSACISCLQAWRKECIEWCFDRCEDGKFADQKYLDRWPERCGEELVISSHPGANLAPWNIANYEIRTQNGITTVSGRELIFTHYQSFKLISKNAALWVSWNRNKKIRREWNVLPRRYLAELQKTMKLYPAIFKDWQALFSFRGTAPGKREEKILGFIPGKFLRQLVHILYVLWSWRRGFFINRK